MSATDSIASPNTVIPQDKVSWRDLKCFSVITLLVAGDSNGAAIVRQGWGGEAQNSLLSFTACIFSR